MISHSNPWPALRGGLLALLAAVFFGISTPLVQRFGAGFGAFTTAALLYVGAALVGALSRHDVGREARLARTDLPRLLAIAAFGAIIGPVALAWGLQRSSATSASLMLTLEALFTAVFAWHLYRESIGGRVWAALLLLIAGAVVLIVDQGRGGEAQLLGLLAVALATAAWGVDNTLSRSLAERDPGQVVLAKAGLGSCATAILAFVWREPAPSLTMALALGLGDRSFTTLMLLGSLLMLAGVVLHLGEAHGHEHEHETIEHEHAHRHDEGHHTHTHDPKPVGPHSHRHRHEPLRHIHAHVPDAHHSHEH